MSELPRGWALAYLEELAESVRNGVFVSRPAESPPGEPILRISAVRPMRLDASDIRFARNLSDKAEAARLAVGDVLFTRYSGTRDYVGACAVVGEEAAGMLHPDKLIRVVSRTSLVDPRYLVSFCSSPAGRRWLEGVIRTTAGQTGLAGSDLKRLPVALAPRKEQERIVAAIEEAFSKLDAGEAGLRAVRQLLKRMRVVVLAVAVTGRLVPQDPSETSATRLLADLGVAAFEDPRLPLLPPSWSWARVQDVGQVDLGRQRSPKYHSGDNMKPYLRVANVFEDRIDTSDVMEMHFEPEAFERSRLVVGDIVLNEGQTPELLGRPAMYRGDPPEVAFTNSLLRFRAGTGIEPEWALLVFRHHMHSGRFTRESRITTNIAHLSAARFKPVEFPVPPAEEQRRIVEEFARQSSFIDACERAVDAGLARSAGLRRSVLKAAFEGRLVPQDPSDEPASVLLQRIRAERAENAGSSDGRRTKKVEAL